MATQAVKGNVLPQLVARAGSLYSLPAVAVEVLELTAQPNVDTAALRRCVERDPALTAKLLRVVNSSMYGLSREVTDLGQALTLLGVKPLKLLVLGFSLPGSLYAGVEAETLSRFWRYTLVKAVAARELSKAFWSGGGEEAFIAGLLQEIGVLVLIQELGDSYVSFLNSVYERGEDLIAWETATLGFDHAILSARLLEHWNLPPAIVRAVAAPLDPACLPSVDPVDVQLVQTLHLATLMASLITLDRQQLMPPLLEAAAQYRGITVQQIAGLMDELQKQVDLMAGLFSVRVSQHDSFREILARAHQQMSAVAVELLPQLLGASGAISSACQEGLHDAVDDYARRFVQLSAAVADQAGMEHASAGSVRLSARIPASPVPETPTAASDPGLRGKIQSAIALCRTRQRELSLILLEVDDCGSHLLAMGPERMTRLVYATRLAVQELADTPHECLVISDTRCAILLVDCDRRQAIELARLLLDAVPAWLVRHGSTDSTVSFSAGIASLATPTHASRPDDLIEAADRCLFAAQRSGGGVTKSIDLL